MDMTHKVTARLERYTHNELLALMNCEHAASQSSALILYDSSNKPTGYIKCRNQTQGGYKCISHGASRTAYASVDVVTPAKYLLEIYQESNTIELDCWYVAIGVCSRIL